MNDRIDEIAQAARDHAGGYWDEYSPGWFQFYNQKFAELILEECIGQIIPESILFDRYINLTDLRDAVMRVEHHFGV
jgi:hypothetical protein